ncbi:hypothetical protein ACKWTF_002695 [Chironomus riparius]
MLKLLKLLKTSKSNNSVNGSKDISSNQIILSDALSENEFQNEPIIQESCVIDGNGAKINITYNQERVNKFKTDIFKYFTILLPQTDCINLKYDKSLELSYVKNIFEKQFQKFDISANCIKNGNGYATVQTENTISCTTSSNMIDNIEACASLMQILLKNAFENSKQEELDNDAKKMLQLYTKFRLDDKEPFVSYAKWIAYTEHYQLHSFDPDIFLKLLDCLICQSKKKKNKWLKIFKALFRIESKKSQDQIIFSLNFSKKFESKEELSKIFWESETKLLDCFLNYIHDLHYNLENDDANLSPVYLEKIFEIIAKINTLNDVKEKDLQLCVKESLTHGAIEQITKNTNYSILNNSSQNIKRLDELINILVWIKKHMVDFNKKYGTIFETFFKTSFTHYLYPAYDEHLVKIIQPVILQITDMSKEKFKTFNKDDEDVLIKVFELYREINNFLDFVMNSFKIQDPNLREFTDWFLTGIDSWRKASMMTVLFRIEKSIDVDKLQPELDSLKYSTSVIDTMQILFSTKNFWEHLQWFDKHKDADLVKEITKDLCYAITCYLEKFIDKAQNTNGKTEDDIKKISKKLSLIIANHNYGLENLRKLLDEFIKNNSTDRTEIKDQYQKTEKDLNEKIHELITLNLKPISINIEKRLAEDAKASRLSETKTYDCLFTYIEDILATLHSSLPNYEFEIAKSILFHTILNKISKLIESATKNKKPIEYFMVLNQNFEILKEIFNYSIDPKDETANDEVIKKIKSIGNLLGSYNLNSMQLIHHYYIHRYKMQQMSEENSTNLFGVLTIRCSINDNVLKIHILNAKNLIGGIMNKKFDSYVKVFIIPHKRYPMCQEFKTKIKQNNDSPLYDETVEFTLTEEQLKIKDSIIYFNVMKRFLIGGNGCNAEAFLSFEDIPKSNQNNNLQEFYLKMTRLQNYELEILKVIQYKSQTGDKDAKKFWAKINRLPTTP